MKKKLLLLVNTVENKSIYEVPEPVALLASENRECNHYPFPLTQEQQFELLCLVRTRKSGIITREELQNIIFAAPTLH